MKRIAIVLLGLTGALCGCATGLDRPAAELRSVPRPRAGATFNGHASRPSYQETARERWLNPAFCRGDAGVPCQ